MENNLVVKANNLIQARYKLTLNEQRIILYAVGKLDTNSEDFSIIPINIRSFFKLLNTSQERYSEIREIIRGLTKKEIIIQNQGNELITNWLSSMEYKETEGIIELEFSQKLKPYLLELQEKFTRYQLENILNLQNKHSIRVYELLKQYEAIGKREIKVDILRDCLGIKKNEYSRFYDFERFVLKASKKEINKHTDLTVDYKKIKTGRRITSIFYMIKSKKENEEVYVEFLNKFYDIKDMQLKMGLKDINLNPKQVMSIYEKAVEVASNEDIDLFEYIRLNYLHIKDKARNKYGYLLKAVENDYGNAGPQLKLGYRIDSL